MTSKDKGGQQQKVESDEKEVAVDAKYGPAAVKPQIRQNRPMDSTTPRRGRGRLGSSKSRARERSPRAACDFCHNKRVKCVMRHGQPRCEQCTQRDTTCIFSLKGKTGPKPKSEKDKKEVVEDTKNKKNCAHRKKSLSTKGDLTKAEEQDSPPEELRPGNALPPQLLSSHQPRSSASTSPYAAVVCTPLREREFLEAYIRTIGQMLPLVHDDALRYALRERQRLPQAMAAARGVGRIALEQAEVTGALSVGALIKGDMRAGDEYRLALEAHLSGIPSNTEPRAAPALSLMALYWQHLGDDDLKLHWLGYVRGALGNGQVSGDMVLCIEYLDYVGEARPRPGVHSLSVTRCSLHTISCLLSHMPNIVNPNMGRVAAVSFCDDLGECLRGLQSEANAELPKLLCNSLRALLLVMLGRGDKAMKVLQTVPSLIREVDGGNPDVMRALPLSWDALLISGALMFLLGQLQIYRRLRTAASTCSDQLPPEARWSYCLPDPDSDPHTYVDHVCDCSSNICTIVCDIALKTSFGQMPFYTDGYVQGLHLQQEPPFPDFAPTPPPPPGELGGWQNFDDHGALAGAGPLPAGGIIAPSHVEGQPTTGGQSFGYGAGGMAMRSPDLWGVGAYGNGVGAGGEGRSRGYGSGGRVARADRGGNGLDGGDISNSPYKRRKVKSAQNPLDGESPMASDGMDNNMRVEDMASGRVGGGGSEASVVHGLMPKDAYQSRCQNTNGSDYDGKSGADDDGLGLSRGLHNMSLTRLAVSPPVGGDEPATGSHRAHGGALGRVPSEDIMDLGSTIGSFTLGSMGSGLVNEDFIELGEESRHNNAGFCQDAMGGNAGDSGGARPQQRRLSSFIKHRARHEAYSVRIGSRSRMSEGGGSVASGGRCGGGPSAEDSDIGAQDEAVVTVVTGDEYLMDGSLQHGNTISVDALLRDVVSTAPLARYGSHHSSSSSSSTAAVAKSESSSQHPIPEVVPVKPAARGGCDTPQPNVFSNNARQMVEEQSSSIAKSSAACPAGGVVSPAPSEEVSSRVILPPRPDPERAGTDNDGEAVVARDEVEANALGVVADGNIDVEGEGSVVGTVASAGETSSDRRGNQSPAPSSTAIKRQTPEGCHV